MHCRASVQVSIHETEFFAMSLNLSDGSLLDVSMDASECNVAQSVSVSVFVKVADGLVHRIFEEAGEHE